MKLVVLAHGASLDGVEIHRDRPNPGIGGTQFTRIRLADAFAQRFPQHSVALVSDHEFTVADAPKNLRQVTVDRFEDVLTELPSDRSDWIVTGPSMLVCRLDPSAVRAVAARTILTSHLMYDCDLWEAERITRFGAVAGVGAYNFHSMRTRSPRVYLRNLFHPGWSASSAPTGSEDLREPVDVFRIVHIGALLPLKGFHDLARLWPEIRDRIPNVRLDVIGGSSTYGHDATHPDIPTDREFGDRILQHLPVSDIRNGLVTFHGNVGAEKESVIRGADVAVLNVAGRPECFPGALLECLDLGVPVVGSAANGLWDGMRHFPEVTTTSPEQVVTRLERLIDEPGLRTRLAERARSVGQDFRNENEAILKRWEKVGAALLQQRRPEDFSPSPHPVPAWKLSARHRTMRGRYELSRSGTLQSMWRLGRRVRA
jgi:glycosyltransferase involved in cell wall biosynthesis